MIPSSWDRGSTALLLVDLQRDFIDPGGAYGRAGVTAPEIAALPTRLAPLAAAARNAGVPVIATAFTLVPAPNGPLIADHLRELRPFLGAGDFAPGSWGHGVVDELQPVDIVVEKVAYSAFHSSRLEFVLRRLGVATMLTAGIVTNGGVASTVRDAHTRDLPAAVVADGCAAFTPATHESALASLATVAPVADLAAVLEWLSA